MSIQSYQLACQQNVAFQKVNSGYAPTQAGATGNSFSVTTTSGSCYLFQTPVAGAGTQSVDFVSGGLKDLVGDTVNFSKLFSLMVTPYSGAIQMETTQSGGIKIPQLGLSGGGLLIDPGAGFVVGETGSGYQLPLTAANGNLVFRAVSGGCLLSIGAQGL